MSKVKSPGPKVKSPGPKVKSPGANTTAKSPSSSKAKAKGSVPKTCAFCEQTGVDEDSHGKLLSSKTGLSAHYFCMLFSSGLSQNGKSEKQGILGFLPDDILREVRRGSRLRCSFCRKTGATIGCVVRNCKKMFHLGCGRENGTLHQFFDTFSSYCRAHRPQQDVPTTRDPSYVCSICMTTVECKPSADTLRAPCCRKAWYHRSCVQSYAKSAGLYFFKCPLCNNKDEFQEEMLTYGIYIPDQDASWETEPHAFQDLLERYQNCDAKICRCAEGRKYDKEGSKWELLICDNCGSQGGHVECHYLIKKGKDYICPECYEVELKHTSPEKKKLTPKRKSLEAPAEDDLSPVEKQTREYPGPSNRMRKTGLPQVVSTSPDGRGLPASPRRRRPPRNREGLPTTSPKKRKRLSVAADQESGVKKQKLISPDGKIHNHSETGVSSKESVYSRKSPFDQDKDSNKRLSLEDFKDTKQFRHDKDKKRSNKKKNVVEPGGSQITLEGWLKLGTFKQKDKSPQDLNSKNNKLADIFKKKTPVKRPAVIEWRGVQLQIKSPRVLLKKNIDISGNLKPRALDLDDKARASVKVPNVVVTTGKALLADLDNDFRVTRNMVSNVDSVRSPNVDPKSATKAMETKAISKNKSGSKCRSLLRDLNEDLSEDELTPKSRESLLRSSGKKKHAVSTEMSHSLGTQVDDGDLLYTPKSRELRSSGKKRQAVSNLDSKNFWTVSDETEPLTPTSASDSNFFPLKGVFDENGNNTPNTKSKSAYKNHAHDTESTPSSSRHIVQIKNRKTVDKPSEIKAESADTKNSPVLRSSSAKSVSIEEITNNRTSERLVTPRLAKASRSLTDLYVSSSDTANEGQTADNTVETSTNKGKSDLTGSVKIRKSPLKSDLKSNHTQNNEKAPSCSKRIVQIKNRTPNRLSLDQSSERKAESADVKNSPVLRSSSAQSVSKEEISSGGISEQTIIPKLTRATRSLTDLYVNSFDTANEGQTLDNATNNSNENGSDNLNDSTNIRKSPVESDLAQADIVTMTLQLTPKRRVFVQQDSPPRIQKTRKSLSEFKFSKADESTKGKNKIQAGKDRKVKRYSEISAKSDSVSLKESGMKVESAATLRKDDDVEIVSSPELVSSIKPATPSEKKSSKVSSASDRDLDIKQNSSVEEPMKCSSPLKSNHKNSDAMVAENVDFDKEIRSESKEDILNMSTLDIHSGMKEIEEKCRAKIDALECFAEYKTKGRRKSARNEAKIKSDTLDFNCKPNSLEKKFSDNTEESKSSVSSGNGIKHTKSTAVESRLRSTNRLYEKGKGEVMNFVGQTIEKYIMLGQEKEKKAQNSKSSATVGGQDEDLKKPSSDINSSNLVLPVERETVAEKIVKGGTGQVDNNQNKNSEPQSADNKEEVPTKKRRRIVRSFTGEPVRRRSVEELKATDELAGKFEKKKNPCENTCPNSQPLVDKLSPRPGETLEDNVPLAMFASLLANKRANGYPELQGARTVSPGLKAGPGLRASSYYSSLLASVAKDIGKTGASGVGGKNICSPGTKNSGQTNSLLRLKPNVFQDKKKEVSLQTLAEHMDKAATDFHTLSRSSSRSSDDYASTCPVGLSLSPGYVTKFRRSHSESVEEKLSSNTSGNSSVQKDASVLESLETSVIDLTSDKLAMSEYYAAEGSKKSGEDLRVDSLDLEDIRPLTDIKT